LSLEIDAILVPQGAEFAVVARACKSGPPVFAVPAGSAIVSALANLPIESGQRVLLVGLCGSLDDRDRIGDVVLYRATVSIAGQQWECDRSLGQFLAGMLVPEPERVLALTSPQVIFRAAEKNYYRELFGARVVDMEGQIAQLKLAELGITVGTIRVVSDDSHHDLPDLSNVFDDRGQLQIWQLVKALLRSPLAGMRLVQGSIRGLAVLSQMASQLAID
jgi:nucleoside phosphorylase